MSAVNRPRMAIHPAQRRLVTGWAFEDRTVKFSSASFYNCLETRPFWTGTGPRKRIGRRAPTSRNEDGDGKQKRARETSAVPRLNELSGSRIESPSGDEQFKSIRSRNAGALLTARPARTHNRYALSSASAGGRLRAESRNTTPSTPGEHEKGGVRMKGIARRTNGRRGARRRMAPRFAPSDFTRHLRPIVRRRAPDPPAGITGSLRTKSRPGAPGLSFTPSTRLPSRFPSPGPIATTPLFCRALFHYAA